MNSQFASDMINAIEALTSSFSTFTGGTITGGTWEGDAAENAKNKVTQKINTKLIIILYIFIFLYFVSILVSLFLIFLPFSILDI